MRVLCASFHFEDKPFLLVLFHLAQKLPLPSERFFAWCFSTRMIGFLLLIGNTATHESPWDATLGRWQSFTVVWQANRHCRSKFAVRYDMRVEVWSSTTSSA